MTRRRWFLVAAAVLLLLLAVLGHWAWWYAPRVRAASPDPDDLPGRLLAEGELPVALWVAYPHQNLGALEEGFGSGDERRRFLEALARVADLPEPALPGFGPFAAPPSRELVALSDEAGERVVVAARVYPVLAALSRLAGRLAGNPWLAGGEVEAFGGTATVHWDGTLWTVGNVGVDELLEGDEGGGGGAAHRGDGGGSAAGRAPRPGAATGLPVLAALRLDRPVSHLPAGTHLLRRAEDGLELRTAGDERGDDGAAETGLADLVPSAGAPPAFLAVSGPGGPIEGEGSAFALFSGEGGGGGLLGLLDGLPRAAVWYRPGGERFDLPAEEVLSRLGGEGRAGGWHLLGTSGSAVAAAEPWTPAVDRLAADASLALVTDPAATLAAVDRVLAVLEAVPLVDRDDLRDWRDWHTVLGPLTAYRLVELTSEPGRQAAPGTLRLRLVR